MTAFFFIFFPLRLPFYDPLGDCLLYLSHDKKWPNGTSLHRVQGGVLIFCQKWWPSWHKRTWKRSQPKKRPVCWDLIPACATFGFILQKRKIIIFGKKSTLWQRARDASCMGSPEDPYLRLATTMIESFEKVLTYTWYVLANQPIAISHSSSRSTTRLISLLIK